MSRSGFLSLPVSPAVLAAACLFECYVYWKCAGTTMNQSFFFLLGVDMMQHHLRGTKDKSE
jgi:hypothetical protein